MIFKNEENLKYLFYTEKAPHSHTRCFLMREKKNKPLGLLTKFMQFPSNLLRSVVIGPLPCRTGVGLFDWNLFKIPDHVRLIMANKQQRTQ